MREGKRPYQDVHTNLFTFARVKVFEHLLKTVDFFTFKYIQMLMNPNLIQSSKVC